MYCTLHISATLRQYDKLTNLYEIVVLRMHFPDTLYCYRSIVFSNKSVFTIRTVPWFLHCLGSDAFRFVVYIYEAPNVGSVQFETLKCAYHTAKAVVTARARRPNE